MNIFQKIINKWLKEPFRIFSTSGLTPSKLALSFSLGVCMGINPVPGTTTLGCVLVAFIYKLNHGAIQLINYMVYPLQLLLIYPFFKISAYVLGSEIMTGSPTEFVQKFSTDWWGTLSKLGYVAIGASIIWILISIPLGLALYRLSLPVFVKISSKRN
ncbi:MAG: DUF2062 domain-containing protein [Lentimicrobium sp.]|nr:DUF2062 domain-containing protein [Lentimicrobium sp.]